MIGDDIIPSGKESDYIRLHVKPYDAERQYKYAIRTEESVDVVWQFLRDKFKDDSLVISQQTLKLTFTETKTSESDSNGP